MEIEKTYPMLGKIGSVAQSSIDWRTAPIKAVAEFSPQVALARSYKIPFAPLIQAIQGTFTNTTDTIGPFSFPTNARVAFVSVVDQIVLHIDAPNLNAGNALKPFIDFFFGRQSGIQATMQINNAGPSSYVIAPQFIPVDNLVSMITEGWPCGWVLNNTQAPQMGFTTGFALPSVPVTITCSFRMWQPTRVRALQNMSDAKAIEILVERGELTAEEAAKFNFL